MVNIMFVIKLFNVLHCVSVSVYAHGFSFFRGKMIYKYIILLKIRCSRIFDSLILMSFIRSSFRRCRLLCQA